MRKWRRYVAVGDSFTEGLEDPGTAGRHRGWADRVAQRLALETDGFEYANLAIRGRLLNPILTEQLPQALGMDPDLISIAGGVNDVLRPRWDLASMVRDWDVALGDAAASGATVVIITFGQLTRRSRALGSVQARLAGYREELLRLAKVHGAEVVDFWYARVFDDPRMWAPDRLHLNSIGHERVADAVLEKLGYPVPDWLAPLPPQQVSPLATFGSDVSWVTGHLTPWLGRRMLGRSSGDGIRPKRPRPAPVIVLDPSRSR